MENIIKKAIEGEYEEYKTKGANTYIFLDPLFWQALGIDIGIKDLAEKKKALEHFHTSSIRQILTAIVTKLEGEKKEWIVRDLKNDKYGEPRYDFPSHSQIKGWNDHIQSTIDFINNQLEIMN